MRNPAQETVLAVFGPVDGLPLVTFTQAIPDGAWKELKIIIYNRPMDGGPEGEVDVYINGVRAALSPLPVELQATVPLLGIGVAIARGPMGAFQMSADNVRFYWH